MSSNGTMTFRVAVEGYETQEFRVSPRLLRLYIEDMREAFDKNGIARDGTIIRMVTVSHEDLRVGWRGFFEYIYRGSFTIPDLIPAATGLLAGNRSENFWRVEEEIFQAYDLAMRFDLVDYQNKIMDALYELGRLTNRHLSPGSMQYILERLDPDNSVSVRSVDRYAALAEDFPELIREVFLRQAECALYERHYPDRVSLVHMYWGYCEFHEHPDGECYLVDGSRPWGQVDDQPDSDDEVEMEDRSTQTDDVMDSHLIVYATRKDSQTQSDEEMDGDESSDSYEADIRSDVAEISSDESEKDISALIRKKCQCSDNERNHIGHRCR
ncbi:hypothetical protein DL98DRAFT_527206 [Cadophora sp. DSE1049]|nr:hypothetical protein DL98DRAFT_527206 [Cadophora sp. DSE1049]